MPNATELEFVPGTFYHDTEAGKLYISPSDLQAAGRHSYTVSVIPTHGFYLSNPERVIVDGLAATGFTAAKEINRRDYTLNGTWGIFLVNGRRCVIRNCRAWLNAQGIGMNSHGETAGGNTIDRCTAWANASEFGVGDRGGLTLVDPRRDTIRDSVSYSNGDYGINIRGGGKGGLEEKNKSRLVRNLAWGNGKADIKIKTGYGHAHVTERCVGLKGSNTLNPTNCLFAGYNGEVSPDNIVLEREDRLDVDAEFADPANHDYRLQATSRFRGSGPNGADRGPFPYEPNVFYVKPSGDDAADGLSVSNAWKTLARATRDLEPAVDGAAAEAVVLQSVAGSPGQEFRPRRMREVGEHNGAGLEPPRSRHHRQRCTADLQHVLGQFLSRKRLVRFRPLPECGWPPSTVHPASACMPNSAPGSCQGIVPANAGKT
jgi:hypothetical protein